MKNKLPRTRVAVAALVLGIVISLPACVAMGTSAVATTDASHVNQYIIDGKTTTADVQAVFGEPTTKTPTFWYYSAPARGFLPSASAKTLGVYFDVRGIVTKHIYADTSQSQAAHRSDK